jgi:hypothetical protein
MKNNILFLSNLWPSDHPDHMGNQQQLGKYISDFSKEEDARVFFVHALSEENLDQRHVQKDDEFLKRYLSNRTSTCTIQNLRHSFWVKELFFPSYLYFSPTPVVSIDLETYLKDHDIRLIVIFVCYWLAELCCDYSVPVHLVAGTPDPSTMTTTARLKFQKREIGIFQYLYLLLKWGARQRSFNRIIRRTASIGVANKVWAKKYGKMGARKADFIPVIYPIRYTREDVINRRKGRKNNVGPLRITVGVGHLSSTVNQISATLLEKIIHRIENRFVNIPFEIVVYGVDTSGDLPAGPFENLIQRHGLTFEGWVSNLEERLFDDDIFLSLISSKEYDAGGHRFCSVMGTGCCLVAHQDIESHLKGVEHNRSALLGDNLDSIVDQLHRAALDSSLRYDIGINGYDLLSKNNKDESYRNIMRVL